MAVTPNLGLASPPASAVTGWIARIKADLGLIDQAFAGVGGTPNLLVNPGFAINQRGLLSYAGDGVYALDRWRISLAGAVTFTVIPTAAAFAPSLSTNSARCDFVRGAGTAATLEQSIENPTLYRGVALTFAVWVSCAIPNTVRAVLADGVATTYSAYHGGGGWQRLTVTRTLDAAATAVKVGVYFSDDCTAWLDNATLAVGSTPLPFAPLRPEEDLRRCQRYYEVQGRVAGGAGGHPVVHGYAGAGAEVVRGSFSWATAKGGAPTVTRSGAWSLINASAVGIAGANESGYSLNLTASGAGQCEAAPNTAGDYISGEWNP